MCGAAGQAATGLPIGPWRLRASTLTTWTKRGLPSHTRFTPHTHITTAIYYSFLWSPLIEPHTCTTGPNPTFSFRTSNQQPHPTNPSKKTLSPQGHGDPLPPMIWGTNNWRLATATMFTLFFAGDTFAPATTAFGVPLEQGGQPIQQFLQGHFIAAMAKVRILILFSVGRNLDFEVSLHVGILKLKFLCMLES
jgi:hypothetical protein